jgi:hypothetical protein
LGYGFSRNPLKFGGGKHREPSVAALLVATVPESLLAGLARLTAGDSVVAFVSMPLPPTAKAVPLLCVATAVNPAVPVAETTFKLMPSHCSTRSPSPTTKTSSDEEPETAVNWPGTEVECSG